MKKIKKLNERKMRRIGRVRALISGTTVRPRLVVNRTNRYIYAQLIDDTKGNTVLSASNLGGKASAGKTAGKMTKSEAAAAIGEALAKKAVEKGIKTAVFDRRSYRFHGRIKSFVEGAKKGGLTI